VLHDGPPYANGNIHIGHALNKILKDVVTEPADARLRFQLRAGLGLPRPADRMEDRGENYRSKGKPKPDFRSRRWSRSARNAAPMPTHWLNVQREEFKRLGVDRRLGSSLRDDGAFAAEAQIARELMKFAANGTLYRGSKPVMWSVVEKTALAEAEVEYEDYTSDTVWVKFPVTSPARALRRAIGRCRRRIVVIWTTTPWTLPATARSASRRRSPTASTRSPTRPPTIGRSPAIC
jgi:isoleucyl-tRNA synthetase